MKRLDHYWYSQNLIAWLLLPLSGLYCVLSFLRRQMYLWGVLKQRHSPVPVIIVGNISVGGTGKTPFLIYLCQQLQQRGFKPGIISRGYGGRSEKYPLYIREDVLPAQCGDEPFMIARRTACPVVVGPDRYDDITELLQHQSCNIILADDGMQHYALQRDAEIAVVDAVRQFGNGFCLPAGPLREPPGRLKSVDMVIFNGGDEDEMSFKLVAGNLVQLQNHQQTKLLTDFAGQRVHAVAGIGNPQRFFDLLRSHNINFIAHTFPDHHAYQPSDLDFGDHLPVVMTEKDAVKCFDFRQDNAWYLPVDVRLSSSAQRHLFQLVEQVCNG